MYGATIMSAETERINFKEQGCEYDDEEQIYECMVPFSISAQNSKEDKDIFGKEGKGEVATKGVQFSQLNSPVKRSSMRNA